VAGFLPFSAAFVLTFLMNLLMLREYIAVFADFIVLDVGFFVALFLLLLPVVCQMICSSAAGCVMRVIDL